MIRNILLMIAALFSLEGCLNITSIQPRDMQLHDGLTLAVHDFLNEEAKDTYYSTRFIEDNPDIHSIVNEWRGSMQIKFGDKDMRINGNVVEDTSINKPAKLLKFHLVEITPNRLIIEASWYSSTLSSGTISYEVVKYAGKWVIAQKSVKSIS